MAAEAIARQFGGAAIEAFSAGIAAEPVDPEYHALMREIGIDTTGQASRTMDANTFAGVDLVVTLCDPATGACPIPPAGVRHLDWRIPGWEVFSSDRTTGLGAVRDAIRERVERLVDDLRAGQWPPGA